MAKQDYKISRILQQTYLTILAMDTENGLIIRNTLPHQSFEGPYGDIALALYDYYDEYKKAPGKANLDMALEHLLPKNEDDKTRKSARYERAAKMMLQTWDEKPNVPQAMSRLATRQQAFIIKDATYELVELFNQGIEGPKEIEQMQQIISSAARTQVEAFNPGSSLSDVNSAMSILYKDRSEEVLPTGIPELDKYHLGPRRKGLHLFTGLAKTGKSRWLAQIGQHAMMTGFRVMHITLEMSEEEVKRRYLQSYFSIADSVHDDIYRTRIIRDKRGRVLRLSRRKVKPRNALDKRGFRTKLRKRLKSSRFQAQAKNLKIKEFPTRQLDYNGLVAYMDRMELQEKFVPDLLIVDYPKIMKYDHKDPRIGLGELVEKLRGLGVERNLAVAAVAQVRRINRRQGEDEGTVTGMEIGEDFSQIQTLDTGLVYRQTRAERQLNVARILVDTVRAGKAGWELFITQNYDMGQFCVDSQRMHKDLWPMIEKKAEDVED